MKNIRIETLKEIAYPSWPRLSQDGSRLVYRVYRFDTESNGYPAKMYLYAAGETKALPEADNCTDYAWMDNNRLLLAEKKDADTSFFVLNTNTGVKSLMYTLKADVQYFRIFADGSLCLVCRTDLYGNRSDKWSEIREIPFWGSGRGIFAGFRNRLFIYKPYTKELRAITPEDFSLEHLSVYGSTAAFSGTSYRDVYDPRVGVYLYKDGRTEELAGPKSLYVTDLCCMKDCVMLSATDRKQADAWQPQDVFRLSFDGKLENLIPWDTTWFTDTSLSDVSYGASGYGCADGETFYFTKADRAGAALYKMDKNGKVSPAFDNTSKGADSPDAAEGHVVYRLLSEASGPELYLDGKKITSVNDAFSETFTVRQPEYIPFKNRNGDEIDGWIIYPAGYEKGKKYPAILNIHGGPRCYYTDLLFHEMQAEASEGYFVIFCNPRGSDGRNRAFGDLYGKYGSIDYEDIMDFTDHAAVFEPDLDAERIGVCGGSYGGFMVNWIIGHTNRYAAAVSQRSISDWIMDEFVSEIGYFWTPSEMAAEADEDPEKLWDMSPLKYAKNARTPTLFIHSDEDYLCPIADTAAMFTALKRRGVDSKFVIFHGENHGLSRTGSPQSRLKRLTEILGWFEAHLKNGKE